MKIYCERITFILLWIVLLVQVNSAIDFEISSIRVNTRAQSRIIQFFLDKYPSKNFTYKITWKKHSESTIFEKKLLNASFVIKNLEDGQPYEVTVDVFEGEGIVSSIRLSAVPGRVSPAEPKVLQIQSVNGTAVVFSVETSINIICYQMTVNGAELTCQKLNPGVITFTATSLSPAVEYVFYAASEQQSGTSRFTKGLVVRTGPVTSPEVVTSATGGVNWISITSTPSSNDVFAYYVILFPATNSKTTVWVEPCKKIYYQGCGNECYKTHFPGEQSSLASVCGNNSVVIKRYGMYKQDSANHIVEVFDIKEFAKLYRIVLAIVTQTGSVSYKLISRTAFKSCHLDCARDAYAAYYEGQKSVTVPGLPCVRWDSFIHKYYNTDDYGVSTLNSANYCRRAGYGNSWCYIRSGHSDGNWENCHIPVCREQKRLCGQTISYTLTSMYQSINVAWVSMSGANEILLYYILVQNGMGNCISSVLLKCTNCPDLQNNYENYWKQLQAYRGTCNVSTNESLFNSRTTTFSQTMNGLVINNQYTLYLYFVDKDGPGSALIHQFTTVAQLPTRPIQLVTTNIATHSIAVKWQTERSGTTASTVSFAVSLNSLTVYNVKQQEYSFLNLASCTHYCAQVWGRNVKGDGEKSEVCAWTKTAEKDVLPITSITIEKASIDAVKISWKSTGQRCPVFYEIEVNPGTGKTYSVNSTVTRTDIRNLTRHHRYSFRVAARSQDGEIRRNWSPRSSIFIGKVCSRVTDLSLTNNSQHWYTLSWKQKRDEQCVAFAYLVRVVNSTGSCLMSSYVECSDCLYPFTTSLITPENLRQILLLQTECIQRSENTTFLFNEINVFMKFNTTTLAYETVEVYPISGMGIGGKAVIKLNVHDNGKVTTAFAMIVIPVTTSVIVLIAAILVTIFFIRWYIRRKSVERVYRSWSSNITMDVIGQLNPIRHELMLSQQYEDWLDTISPGRISLSRFTNHLGDLLTGRIQEEFEIIHFESKTLVSRSGRTTMLATNPLNASKNMCSDIYPYDQTRVALQCSKRDHNIKSYINASYVDGPYIPKQYIAAQGPMITTLSDFWRMIWEQDVRLIVMLTKTTESGVLQCQKYWPDSYGASVEYNFNGNIMSITLHSVASSLDYIIRYFDVAVKNVSRRICKLHFLDWEDNNTPDLNQFSMFMRQFNELKSESAAGPILVHCRY